MDYRDEIIKYIDYYKNGSCCFEDCVVECVEILRELKVYYFSLRFQSTSVEKDISKLMSKARIFFLTELVKALIDNI